MAVILDFKSASSERRTRPAAPSPSALTSGTVVIFLGVRYERACEEPVVDKAKARRRQRPRDVLDLLD